MSTHKIGEIGYEFRKQFNVGWFTGEVVEIRPGAAEGRDRRCLYSDWDFEDLSVAELKHLARLDPKSKYYKKPRSRSLSPKPAGSKSGLASGNSSISSGSIIRKNGRELTSNKERQNKRFAPDQKPAASRKSSRERKAPTMYGGAMDEEQHLKRAASSKPSNRAKIQKLLSSLSDDEVPVDKAAESTIRAEDEGRTWYDISDELDTNIDQNQWLEKVASQLGARRRPISRNSVLSLESQGKSNVVTSSTAVAAINPNDSTIVQQPKNPLPSMPHSIEVSLEYQPSDSAPAMAQLKKSQAEATSECSSVPSSVLVSHKPSVLPGSQAMRTLIDIEKGSRHEYLVFRKDDPDRLVGEVLVEGIKGWVEVCFGGTALVKCRSSHLIVLPKCKFGIGDRVPEDYIAAFLEEKSESVPSNKTDDFNVLSATKKPLEKKSTASKQQTVNLDDLFYWVCECEQFNLAKDRSCKSCRADITGDAKQSKLLEIATDIVNNDYVSSLEEAILQIPETDRQSIPRIILAQLIEAKFPEMNLSQFCEKSSTKIETFFYWSCGSCTMLNSYKRGSCYACRDGKGFFARSSPLLQKAEEIALQSNSPKDAYATWPAYETRQIPEVVMDLLITCVHIICRKGTKRRCRNRKLEGVDYCQDHCDPALLTAQCRKEVEETRQSVDINSSESSLKNQVAPMGIDTVKPALQSFLTNKIDNFKNDLGWSLNSVEDALVCGSDLTPFPLGMKVRVYFVGHGFHDGRIIKVRRQYLSSSRSDGVRPVLVYRVIFNDGDQQDWLHHNISSLRQVFDVNNIDPEAPPEEQIPLGTLFEMKTGVNIKIIDHTVSSQDEQVVSFVVNDDINESPTSVELSLVKFQEAVKRKIDSEINADRVIAINGGSIVEWPVSNDRVEQLCTTGTGYKVCHGLHILSKANKTDYSVHPFTKLPSVDNPIDATRPGVTMATHDPANIRPFIHWDPSQCLVCQLCGIDKDDNQVVICDECHLGFHSYCLRPVMVNIPLGDWVCRQCSGVSNSLSFVEYSKSITGQQQSVLQFLNLPYKSYIDFVKENNEAMAYSQSPSTFNPSKHTVIDRNIFSVGYILFVRHPAKHDFRLPSLALTPEEFALSLESFVAAMKYCGMSRYTESNTYPQGGNATEEMNDLASEKQPVVSLSKRNLSIFRAFKENIKRGVFPPIKVMHDERYGFYVEALKVIPKHTLIAEYIGEVITLDLAEESESDSLMILLDSGDPKTSLIIDPTNAGNIARFLSGVNNKSLVSKRKANVRTRRFCLDGKLHVVLFTSRRIETGESLNYDYNAGRQGQSPEEWLKGGFYDTSNFF